MPEAIGAPDLDSLLVKEGYVISSRTKDGRRKFYEVIDQQPVSFLATVKAITGSRLTARDTTGATTSTFDTGSNNLLKKLRPDQPHMLQLLVGIDAEPHPGAQRVFAEVPLGTSLWDLDQGRADAKNIGYMDGRLSSVEAPSGMFQMWLTNNLIWGLKFVNNYPLTADPKVWFVGSLFVADLLGIETVRGGPLTQNGKPQSQGNPAVARPQVYRPVPVGRIEQVPASSGSFVEGA